MEAESNAVEVTEQEGLLFGCILDGAGSAKLVDWPAVENWEEKDGPLWVHLDRNNSRTQNWLRQRSGLTQPTIDALLADETRPRVFRGKRGIIAILRGVNTNPDSDPEDMVALRIWSDGNRVITLRFRKVMTPRDILTQLLELEDGPQTAPTLFERLISRLVERIAPTVAAFDETLDELESRLDTTSPADARRQLSNLRQGTVILRRYLSPQREALNSLLQEPPPWLDEHGRIGLRETADRMLRYLEELDSARERAMVIKDDISNQLAESTNKTLYMLSIISAIFLPLGFLTGLLGINVGGMPGVESGAAFWVACGLMGGVLLLEILLLRKLRWL